MHNLTHAIALFLITCLSAQAADKPNIIVIYADDMGYGDCTANNPESKIRTPNIDRLAKEGLRFTDAHSPGSTCTASRYGLLTGINPARRGVVNGINGLGPVLEEKELTIAEMLKAQGYATRMVGKWHLGFELTAAEGRMPVLDLSKPFVGGPLDHGFDAFLGMNSAMSSGPYYYIRDRGPEVLPTETTKGTKAKDRDRRETYATGDLATGFVHEEVNSRLCDEVIDLLKEHSTKDGPEPLFLYYAMLEPHTPWLPEEHFAGKSGAGSYGNYVVQLDHELGRVLNALKESGMENDTLLFFSSDNGALWPEADIEKYGHRANGPLAGGKARPEEGGHRVPFIARWPGRIPAGTKTDALINHTDILATLAELLDLEDVAREGAFDSHSFLPVLREPGAEHERPAMAVTVGSFRKGDWKLTFNRGRRIASFLTSRDFSIWSQIRGSTSRLRPDASPAVRECQWGHPVKQLPRQYPANSFSVSVNRCPVGQLRQAVLFNSPPPYSQVLQPSSRNTSPVRTTWRDLFFGSK